MIHDDPWATLPDKWRALFAPPERPTPPRPATQPIRCHLKLPDAPCGPYCIRCGRTEQPDHHNGPMWKDEDGLFLTRLHPTHGTRDNCTWICERAAEPGLTQVCIATTRAIGRIATGTTGRRIAVVDTCPHCGNSHIHTAHPEASPYRRSGCGQPYVLEIA